MNRKSIQRLRRLLAIETLYPKRNLSLANHQHKIYPYLLRELTTDRPNQVWSTDINYIPMAKGFIYLVAVMNWYSRQALPWRISTTIDTDFCVDALVKAIERYSCREIFNTDQGGQFSSADLTSVLKANHIVISMDGKGRWVDNVFVERLERSANYKEVYLNANNSFGKAKRSLSQYFNFYNTQRHHQSLSKRTPYSVYDNQPADRMVA